MPQIAQQDYLRITIANSSSPTAAEKAELKKAVENGTIWDCILVYPQIISKALAVNPIAHQVGFADEDGTVLFINYE